jgi:pilus assembly protein Flp/PilA
MSILCSRFLRDESGATAIEYSLLVAGIAIAILASINSLSTAVQTMLFDVIADAVAS